MVELRVVWNKNTLWKINVLLVLSVSVLSVSLSGAEKVAAAGVAPWSEGVPTVVKAQPGDFPYDACMYRRQMLQTVIIAGITNPQSACMSPEGYLRMGIYNNWNAAVSFGHESKMYKVNNLFCGIHPACIYLPERDTLITRESIGNYYAVKLVIYKNFSKRLHPTFNTSLIKEYTFDYDDPYFILNDSGGAILPVRSMEVSANNKWLVAEIERTGLVRIDLDTMEIRKFSNWRTDYWYAGPTIQYDVTDDGSKIAVMGTNSIAEVYDVNETCGPTITHQDTQENIRQYLSNTCPSFVTHGLSDMFIERYRDGYYPRFSYDGAELQFYANSYSTNSVWVTLRVAGYTPPSQLDYLAMGDSYSSGEGDVEKKPNGSQYYLSGTEQKGGCHISEQSYPFLLRDYYRISTDMMHSVACSGAQVVFDYIPTLSSYRGQHNQLDNLNAKERAENQAAALKSYKPGIIPQLEFVKKYTPKIITVTGGGNDVGFANILNYCASPSWEGFFVDDTCGYAIEGSQLEKLVNNAIDSQYLYNKLLLTKMKASSPDSKIILVGYPSFIASSSLLPCGLNGGFLNGRERDMINRSVHKMNQMLRKVAHDSNVSFVDIEDSLSGGRLCEGSTYMTGLHNLKVGDILSENTAESFHPNHRGNAKIAETIQSSNLFNSNTTFDSGDYTPPANTLVTQSQEIIKGGSVTRTDTGANLSAIPYSFAANSPVIVTGYSDEVDLGTLQAGNDGSIQQSIDMKKLPIGRHVIVLSGSSYSGEPIQYYQFIEVKESSTDSDGDGIPDTNDKCNYITHWYNEETGEDVCLESTSLIAKNQSDSNSANSINNSSSAVRPEDGTIQASNIQPDAQSENKDITNAIINKIKSAISLPAMVVTIALIILTVGTYGIIKHIKKHQE